MNELHLMDYSTKKDLVYEPMKKGYGQGLLEAGKTNPNVVAASSDVTTSTGTDAFASEFPDRFVQVGVAEQNLVTVASGLAAMGKKPFVAAYGSFSPGRNWEQIRTTICINDQPVTVVGTHVGVSDSPDGATHQMLEDIALMRALPNMTVIAPIDSQEAHKATLALADYKMPAYMRIARDDTAIITTEQTPFQIGKAYVYEKGSDVSIMATGRMTYHALLAAEELFKSGIDAEVIHVPTIKPLDGITILGSAKKTGRVVTVEEHQVNGGFGGAIAEFLSEHHPVQLLRVGVKDRFGESGTSQELFEHLGLDYKHIAMAVHQLMHEGSSR
jgi:transketolase